MARRILMEPSRTLAEFRLLPGYTADHHAQDRVSLASVVAAGRGARSSLRVRIPILSAAMQSVTGPDLAVALAEQGGLGVVFCSQTIADEAAMVAQVKASTPKNPDGAALDAGGRLLVAAAISTHDFASRVPPLADAGVDLLVIDASDGHSIFQARALEWVAARYPDLPVMGGNIVTAEAFCFLAEAGADAVKVGMGSGSICITQEQKGTGRGLATALIDVCGERDRYGAKGRYIPVVADGGLVTAKDVVMALAIGADAAMLGRYFARADESPNPRVQMEGLSSDVRGRWVKPYWGEGSNRARLWKNARYHQAIFEEGVDGHVECAGPLATFLPETLAMIRASMSTAGARDLTELHEVAELELVSALSIREGQPHDILLAGQEASKVGR